MRGKVTCLAGQSAVGKSSLLNALFDLGLETGGLSRKTERGRHTTRRAEMMAVDGMFVLDTPGFSLLELKNGLSPEDFAQLYPEYNALAGSCRFQPCLRPGAGVRRTPPWTRKAGRGKVAAIQGTACRFVKIGRGVTNEQRIVEISPSVLGADLMRLGEEIKMAESLGFTGCIWTTWTGTLRRTSASGRTLCARFAGRRICFWIRT
ncbi:MAG: GTPase RsgA, partial [Christensenellales bacterium]